MLRTDDDVELYDGTVVTFTDDNINGMNVVGDTLNQYFYTVMGVDIYGNRSTNIASWSDNLKLEIEAKV